MEVSSHHFPLVLMCAGCMCTDAQASVRWKEDETNLRDNLTRTVLKRQQKCLCTDVIHGLLLYASGFDSDSPFPCNPPSLNYSSIILTKILPNNFVFVCVCVTVCHRIKNLVLYFVLPFSLYHICY